MSTPLHILSPSSQWKGNLETQENLIINGEFEGEIQCHQTLTVGKTGNIKGTLRVKSLEVFGTIDCYVVAEDKVFLHPGSKITGTIRCDDITVRDGAKVAGLSISHCGT